MFVQFTHDRFLQIPEEDEQISVGLRRASGDSKIGSYQSVAQVTVWNNNDAVYFAGSNVMFILSNAESS